MGMVNAGQRKVTREEGEGRGRGRGEETERTG